ncbi:MAG: hypothetical protein ACRD1K_00865 [Acidimicrobiales bacterium]
MMLNEFNGLYLTALALPAVLVARLRAFRDQRGSVTTEQAIITAAVVVLALGAVAIISSLVMAKVNSIDLNNTPPPPTPGP